MSATGTIEVVPGEDLGDRAVEALAALLSDAGPDRSPGDPPISPAQLALDARVRPAWRRHLRALAWDGDRLQGAALVELEDRADNRELALVELAVATGARGRGIGRALLAALLPPARDDGRTIVMSGAPEGGPGAAFLAGLGLTVGMREHRNRVRTGDLPRPLLERWVADAASRAAGYSLHQVDGPMPDDLLDPYAGLHLVMNDAPKEDLAIEDVELSAEDLRTAQQAAERRGVTRWTVVARHDATGALAGLTELVIPRHDRWLAEQGDTGVAAAHRGHGLGRWLKAVNALRLLDERPEVEVVETWNAGSNAHMLAINEAMGFRPAAVHLILQGPLEPLLRRVERPR